jgi:hypothetical protein
MIGSSDPLRELVFFAVVLLVVLAVAYYKKRGL